MYCHADGTENTYKTCVQKLVYFKASEKKNLVTSYENHHIHL